MPAVMPRPGWMVPFPEVPPEISEALDACVATCLSEVENFYEVRTIETRTDAGRDILPDWPALPPI